MDSKLHLLKAEKLQRYTVPIISKYIRHKTLLSIGCGSGAHEYLFYKNLDAKIVLTDLCDKRIDQAKRFPFYILSIDDISNEMIREHVDVVFLQYVIHHLDPKIDLEKVFKNLKSVADTIIIIEEIKTDKTNLQVAIDYDKKSNLSLGHKVEFFHYRTNTEFINLFLKTGLNLISNKKYYAGTSKNGFLEKRIYILN